MPKLAPIFAYLVVTYVTFAIALFVPSVRLPFKLRNRLVEHGYDRARALAPALHRVRHDDRRRRDRLPDVHETGALVTP